MRRKITGSSPVVFSSLQTVARNPITCMWYTGAMIERALPPDLVAAQARSDAKRRWRSVFDRLLERGVSLDDLDNISMPRELLHDHIADLAQIEHAEGWRVTTRKAVRDALDADLKREVLDAIAAERGAAA